MAMKNPKQISINMSHIHNKGSDIEVVLRLALWHKGYRYRKNLNTVYGHPDICFPKYKVAVFCDGEFWHGKEFKEHSRAIKSNQEYWIPKIKRNIEHDKEVTEKLEEDGWTVIRFWGNEILKDTDRCVDSVIEAIEEYKKEMLGNR